MISRDRRFIFESVLDVESRKKIWEQLHAFFFSDKILLCSPNSDGLFDVVLVIDLLPGLFHLNALIEVDKKGKHPKRQSGKDGEKEKEELEVRTKDREKRKSQGPGQSFFSLFILQAPAHAILIDQP